MSEFLIVAGDPSGDLHGADLIRSLKKSDPGARVAAVGGAHMKAAADEFLYDLASLGVTGFLEPIRKLPMFYRLLRVLRAFMRERRPTVVCIDYYGFNRRVLGAAKAQGLTTLYYISPQVWASRPGRLSVLKRLVDRMIVIFPFEEAFYKKAGIPVSFVGHPLLDHMPPAQARNLNLGRIRIGLLPGSRATEIRRHLPVFLDALDLMRKDHPTIEALLFAAPHLAADVYAEAEERGVRIIRDDGYRVRGTLDLALTSSGTATLENALLGVPMVVVYRLSWPTYAIARSLVRVPYISMANLLAGKALAPELIQHHATPGKVAQAALDLLSEPRRLSRVSQELAGLRYALGGSGAAGRAAKMILQETSAEPTAGAKGAA
ncbi:MAG: lipid-A-disaccharide synthase [Elusimicrobia bacterium]|nr:lipid-A-disaccharide synthase [Elusimicrobiota bacterium]